MPSLYPEQALSDWRTQSDHGSVLGMTMLSNPYRGFRFPAEVIQHAVRLYHCFSLNLRDVELILAANQHRSARDVAFSIWREVTGVASATLRA